jgi:hypothetical protein
MHKISADRLSGMYCCYFSVNAPSVALEILPGKVNMCNAGKTFHQTTHGVSV